MTDEMQDIPFPHGAHMAAKVILPGDLVSSINDEFKEAIGLAREKAADSYVNSYRAGYDAGVRDGLVQAVKIMRREDDLTSPTRAERKDDE